MMRITAQAGGEEAEEEGSLFLPRSLTLRGMEHPCPMPAVKVVTFFLGGLGKDITDRRSLGYAHALLLPCSPGDYIPSWT